MHHLTTTMLTTAERSTRYGDNKTKVKESIKRAVNSKNSIKQATRKNNRVVIVITVNRVVCYYKYETRLRQEMTGSEREESMQQNKNLLRKHTTCIPASADLSNVREARQIIEDA